VRAVPSAVTQLEGMSALPADLLDQLEALNPWEKVRLTWLLEAREKQLPPPASHQDWLVWLLLSGRGFGKTRVGAEDVINFCSTHPNVRYAVLAPTFAVGRDVCIEGESGVLAHAPPSLRDGWNRSEGRLMFPNGSQVKVFSSEKPDRIRGPQHHRAWVEELAAMQSMRTAWDMLMFGLRLNTPPSPLQLQANPSARPSEPKCIVTTTPKPLKLLRQLVRAPTTYATRGSTFENEANLSTIMLQQLRSSYGNTRLGRQELDGEILDDVIGALWAADDISRVSDEQLIEERSLERALIAVAVDPAVTIPAADTASRQPDETGIIVLARTHQCPCGRATHREPHVIVLDDSSGRMAPTTWGQTVVRAIKAYAATLFIGETNNGGDLVRLNVNAAWSDDLDRRRAVRWHPVTASRSKRVRAEPVATLYRQGRVHHISSNTLIQLEEQMVTWVPPDERDEEEVEENVPVDDQAYTGSPDRVDALVWGVTALLLDPRLAGRGGLRVT